MEKENKNKSKVVYDNPEIILSSTEEEALKRLDALAEVLDSKFGIPKTNIKFGVDAIIGLLPGIGDTITTLISSYLIKEANDLGAPNSIKLKMAFNVFIDWLVGLVPIVGDLLDVAFRANTKNVKLLKDFLKNRQKY